MDINLKFITTSICFGFLTINCSCHKLACSKQFYNFYIGTTLFYPQNDSIHIGDTLYFLSHTNSNLKDVNTEQIIDYSKADNFGSTIDAIELTIPNAKVGAVNDFNWIGIKGKIYTDNGTPSPDIVKQITFEEENEQYILSFAVIPLKTGIFSISTSDLPDVVKNCNRASITMKITNTNNHLYYLKKTYYGGGPIASIDSTHTYNFRVY